jgi:hypothetical protein
MEGGNGEWIRKEFSGSSSGSRLWFPRMNVSTVNGGTIRLQPQGCHDGHQRCQQKEEE